MSAFILTEIPDANISTTVTRNQLPLIRVDNDVIDRNLVIVIALYAACSCVPDLYGAIFRAGDHPFTLTVKGNTGNVSGMAVESKNRGRIGRAYIIKLDVVIACRSKEAFVRRDTETIYLGIGVLDCSRADARQRFPEANRVIIPSYSTCQLNKARSMTSPMIVQQTCTENHTHIDI